MGPRKGAPFFVLGVMLFKVGIMKRTVDLSPETSYSMASSRREVEVDSNVQFEVWFEDFRPEKALEYLLSQACKQGNEGRLFAIHACSDDGQTVLAREPVAGRKMPPGMRDAVMRAMHQAIYQKIYEMHLREMLFKEQAGKPGGFFARLVAMDGTKEEAPDEAASIRNY